MRTAFIESLCEAAAGDPNIWLLTGDLGYSVLEVFSQRFPDRYVNVGVAEQNMMGVAAGLAMSGKTVVAYSIVNFVTLRCLEQIRCDICYHGASVKIVGVGGGYAYGALGHTHHGIEDLSVLGSMPGIDVVAPADPIETRLAVQTLLQRKGPAYLRLGKAGEPKVHQNSPAFGVGSIVPVREGRDVLFITTGGLLEEALRASQQLVAAGLDPAVWSNPWLRPFDVARVTAAAKDFAVIVTAEEGVITGGLGARVAQIISGMEGSRARHIGVGVPPEVGPSALSQKAARARFGLDANALAAQALAAMKRS